MVTLTHSAHTAILNRSPLELRILANRVRLPVVMDITKLKHARLLLTVCVLSVQRDLISCLVVHPLQHARLARLLALQVINLSMV